MAKFIYNGEDEREFPSIAVTIKAGEIFDAPADFSAPNVSPVKSKVGDE